MPGLNTAVGQLAGVGELVIHPVQSIRVNSGHKRGKIRSFPYTKLFTVFINNKYTFDITQMV